MKTTNGTGAIATRKLKTGEKVYTFSIVRNERILGRPTPKQLAYLGTIRSSDISEKASEFWVNADKIIEELYQSNQIWWHDRKKIAEKFETIIKRPLLSKAVANKKSVLEILKERGINL